MGVPQRIFWAVDLLGVEGSDRLLEIGCGNGSAASLVGMKLTSGRVTALDRSAKAIATARQRNAAHEAAGKIDFVEGSLVDFAGKDGAFDKIFAINVNLFWTEPHRELPMFGRLLAPGGRLFLFYEPPSVGQRSKAAKLCLANLERHNFAIDDIIERDVAATPLLAIIAKPKRLI